jgi:hypothetical protein
MGKPEAKEEALQIEKDWHEPQSQKISEKGGFYVN